MPSIFTKIISGEIPSYKIYEDDIAYAFLDINPMQKGHMLVVPKAEVDQLIDLDEKLFDRFMHRVRHVSQLLRTKTGCKRVCMIVEGYAVSHAHIHLIPTNSADEFDKKYVHPASKEELEAAYAMLMK